MAAMKRDAEHYSRQVTSDLSRFLPLSHVLYFFFLDKECQPWFFMHVKINEGRPGNLWICFGHRCVQML